MKRTNAAALPAWHSPADVASMLGVSREKVNGWINRGELRAVNVADRVGGRPRWRISPDALEAFLESRANKSPEPAVRRQRRIDSELASVKRLLDDGIVPYFYSSMREFQYVLKHSAKARQLNRDGFFYLGDDGIPHQGIRQYVRGPKAVCIVPRG